MASKTDGTRLRRVQKVARTTPRQGASRKSMVKLKAILRTVLKAKAKRR